MSSCERTAWLRAAAGQPRQGFHAARLPPPLPDWALWDVVGTIALALATARITGWSVLSCLLGWFLLAQVAHRAACVSV